MYGAQEVLDHAAAVYSALIFTAAHAFLIPKNPGTYYQIVIDGRLPGTFFSYVRWALAPSHLDLWVGRGRRFGLLTAALAGIALLGFALWRSKRRELLGFFCLGWFVLLLVPVLPLPNHIEDYYVTLPDLGLAWLGGWAMVCGWKAGPQWRAATVLMAGMFLGASAIEAERYSRWFEERSEGMRTVVLGLRDAAQAHPGWGFILEGVNDELFQVGFQDDPFRLFSLQKVFLVPGSEQSIRARADLGGGKRWTISPSGALAMIERKQGMVFRVTNDRLIDITPVYAATLRADPRAARRDFVDVGDPFYAGQARSHLVRG